MINFGSILRGQMLGSQPIPRKRVKWLSYAMPNRKLLGITSDAIKKMVFKKNNMFFASLGITKCEKLTNHRILQVLRDNIIFDVQSHA